MRFLLTSFLALGLLTSCGDKTPECVDNGQCNDGQACVDDSCRDVECLSSTECALHQFCDGQAFVCRDGCNDDEDCKAGETCGDNHQCSLYGCRNTVLDCPIGDFCDDGKCREWPDAVCNTCDPIEELLGMQPCGAQGSCWLLEGGSDDVGYCFPDCNPNAEEACPAGFSCEEFPDGTNGCFSDCITLLKNGWL